MHSSVHSFTHFMSCHVMSCFTFFIRSSVLSLIHSLIHSFVRSFAHNTPTNKETLQNASNIAAHWVVQKGSMYVTRSLTSVQTSKPNVGISCIIFMQTNATFQVRELVLIRTLICVIVDLRWSSTMDAWHTRRSVSTVWENWPIFRVFDLECLVLRASALATCF